MYIIIIKRNKKKYKNKITFTYFDFLLAAKAACRELT